MPIKFKATIECDTYDCDQTVEVDIHTFSVEKVPGEAVPDIGYSTLEKLGWERRTESDYYSDSGGVRYSCKEHSMGRGY